MKTEKQIKRDKQTAEKKYLKQRKEFREKRAQILNIKKAHAGYQDNHNIPVKMLNIDEYSPNRPNIYK